MLLKKFEVFGFKSFADRTQLEFNPGINAIVGPNGSGKSNLSDAIRWALGEQSIRSLRGTKLEDVIFSGSAQRRPLSIAEVSLTFDNYDSLLPLDFGEVTITRRVYRSGESEYSINKTPCRLKDLQELLAGTGLGRETMALIGQNNIEEILNCKPEERRLLFEEVIGIARYKTRRKEAARKMEDTEHNLTRVRDLMAEIETTLEPLRESAEKTAVYNKLYGRYVQCRSTVLYHRYNRNAERLSRIEQEELRASDLLISAATQTSLSECEREILAAEVMHLDEQLLFFDRAAATNRLMAEKEEGRQRLAQERLLHIDQQKARIEEERNVIKQNEEQFGLILNSSQEKLDDSVRNEELLQTDFLNLTAQYDERRKYMEALRDKASNARTMVFDRLQAVVDERNRLRDIEKEIESIEQRLQRLNHQHQETKNEHQRHSSTIERYIERLSLHQNEKQRVLNEARENILERERKQQLITHLRQKEREDGQKLQEAVSRNKILSNMQESYEGFSQGSRSVLKSNENWSSGIIGPVAGLLSVPEKYVIAVETALGAALQFIVTKDEATSKAAIDFLKQRRGGRATFLPLSSIKPPQSRDYETAATGAPGVLGLASHLVQVDEAYKIVVEMLLGRTVVATDMDAALRVARNSGQRLRIVTLDGELINPGGAITGGKTMQKEQGFLGRQAELQELVQNIIILKKNAEANVRELAEAEEQLNRTVRHEHELRDELSKIEVLSVETEGQLNRSRQDELRLGQMLENFQIEMHTSHEEVQKYRDLSLSLTQSLETLKMAEEENKSNLSAWQKELEGLEAEKSEFEKRLTDLRLALNDRRHQRQALQDEIHRMKQEQARLTNASIQLNKELVSMTSQEAIAKADLTDSYEEKEALDTKSRRLSLERESCFSCKARFVSDIQRLDRILRDLRKKVRDAEEALQGLRLEKTSCAYEVKACVDQIRTQYGLELDTVKNMLLEGSESELEEEASRCDEQIRELGPINPVAIEEYRRSLDRYEFLQTQADDLSGAADSLRLMILDIDRTMAAKLQEGFAAIHAHFADIFSRLFGGGHASLELTHPEQVLESGIEILVQPPGKRRQNLALLSGGERALTVISLLFAFLAYRPAPFCVIDEIDSALDESNVRRFSEFLREYSRHSQFIVVTHRRGTMEAADILHGVTMEDSGVSRLVSVKFLNDSFDSDQRRAMHGAS